MLPAVVADDGTEFPVAAVVVALRGNHPGYSPGFHGYPLPGCLWRARDGALWLAAVARTSPAGPHKTVTSQSGGSGSGLREFPRKSGEWKSPRPAGPPGASEGT